MSEPIKPKTIDMKVLKDETSVNIEISHDLYSRIQALLMIGIPFENIDSTLKVLNTIKNSDKDPDMATYHTRTLMTLISLIEEAAEKEDKIETKTVDIASGNFV